MHNFFQIYFHKSCKKNQPQQNKRQAPLEACRLYYCQNTSDSAFYSSTLLYLSTGILFSYSTTLFIT